MKELLKELHHRPIAYYPVYKKVTGSTTAGILLSQLMYWWAKMDGEKFYKTDAEIIEETALSDEELRTAKKKLKSLPFISLKLEGVPARTFYYIDADILADSISNAPNKIGAINGTGQGQSTDQHYIVQENTTIEQNSPATAEPPPIAAEKEKCTDVLPPGFDEIWESYGYKQQKADAIKAYKAIKLQSDRLALIAAIPIYKEYLSRPDNSWRQQKLLGAFIRGKMWNDDFSKPESVSTDGMSDENKALMEWAHRNYPNVARLRWLTEEQLGVYVNRGEDMFGVNYAISASPMQMQAHIKASFSELNSNSFKRSQYQDVYSYLCEDLKKRIYSK